MCEISLEPAEVWNETPRKARKKHECSSCGGVIQPKETYSVHFSLCDGEPRSEKICEPCRQAREEFSDAHEALTPTPSYFPRMLGECVAEGDPESEKRWKPMLAALVARRAPSSKSKKG